GQCTKTGEANQAVRVLPVEGDTNNLAWAARCCRSNQNDLVLFPDPLKELASIPSLINETGWLSSSPSLAGAGRRPEWHDATGRENADPSGPHEWHRTRPQAIPGEHAR